MTCQEFIEFMYRYLEEDLSPSERAVFDEHLGVCEECVRFLDSYRTTMDLERLAFTSGEPVPDAVPEALVAAVLAASGDN